MTDDSYSCFQEPKLNDEAPHLPDGVLSDVSLEDVVFEKQNEDLFNRFNARFAEDEKINSERYRVSLLWAKIGVISGIFGAVVRFLSLLITLHLLPLCPK